MRRDNPHGRKPGPLNLDIYSAVLGGRPRIERRASGEPTPRAQRLRVSVRIETHLERGSRKAFLDAGIREQVERCAATAARALAEVRTRFVGAFQESTIGKRDKRGSRPRVEVTIGPAARRTPTKHAA